MCTWYNENIAESHRWKTRLKDTMYLGPYLRPVQIEQSLMMKMLSLIFLCLLVYSYDVIWKSTKQLSMLGTSIWSITEVLHSLLGKWHRLLPQSNLVIKLNGNDRYILSCIVDSFLYWSTGSNVTKQDMERKFYFKKRPFVPICFCPCLGRYWRYAKKISIGAS